MSLVAEDDGLARCPWAKSHPLLLAYHDQEWGQPRREDRVLFEFLILETFQAGLSWLTILKRREAFCLAFDQFDPQVVAAYGPDKLKALQNDQGIIRNRLKIEAAKANAQALLAIARESGTFANYLWGFVDGKPVVNSWASMAEIPAETPVSQALSKDLKAQGFKFVGPTVCYSLMQAVGLVNDHLTSCHCWPRLA